MGIKSTAARYGTVAIAIHWLSAALVVGLLIVGFRAASMIDGEAKADLLRLHAPLGAAILVLTLVRIAWWLFADRKPAEVDGVPRVQALAAKAVHILLYVAILGLAGSGIGLMVLSGAGDILFGNAPGPLPDFWNYLPRYGHAIFARLMVLLVALHAGAALYHHFIRRDGVLSRMWFAK